MNLKPAVTRILILTIFLCFCNYVTTIGQNYYPLVDTNKVWHILEEDIYPPSTITTIWKISGDTIWAEINYKKVFRSVDSLQINWSLYGIIREDTTRKVYYKYLSDTTERLLYDFNVIKNDSLYIPREVQEYPLVVDSIKTILINGKSRKQYFLHRQIELDVFDEIWIEGIGSFFGVLNSGLAGAIGDNRELLCFYENDTLFYQNTDYESCFISTYVDKNPYNNIIVKIYPNPVIGKFIFKVENIHLKNGVIEIFDLGGKKIFTKDFDNNNQVILYKNNLSPGLYFYKLTNNNKFIVSGKIVIL